MGGQVIPGSGNSLKSPRSIGVDDRASHREGDANIVRPHGSSLAAGLSGRGLGTTQLLRAKKKLKIILHRSSIVEFTT